MSFWSSLGGSMITNAMTLKVHKTQISKTMRLAENSHSGVSATNFEAVIPHYEWSASIPFDDTVLIDTDAGMIEGAKIDFSFMDGLSGKFCGLTGTSVEKIDQVVDVSQNIIMYEVSGKGGVLTREVT